jgi:hypothetical protein
VAPVEVEAGARRLLAEARGHQLAEARKQYGLAQKDVAARMGVSIARVSQIEHGEVATLDVIARYVEGSAAGWTWLPTSVTTRCGCRQVVIRAARRRSRPEGYWSCHAAPRTAAFVGELQAEGSPCRDLVLLGGKSQSASYTAMRSSGWIVPTRALVPSACPIFECTVRWQTPENSDKTQTPGR